MKKLLFSLMLLAGVLAVKAADAPAFPGGDGALQKYIKENTKYPAISQEMGVEGIVTVGFVVMPDGSLQDLKVIRLVDPDLEKEALRVVGSMPSWIPAEKDGVPVEAPSKVDIPFVLE